MYNDLPKNFSSRIAWKGSYLKQNESLWIRPFSKNEITELENAAYNFLKKEKNIALLNTNNFILPNLSVEFLNLQLELKKGIGFRLYRGIPVDKYDIKTLATIYFGLGSYVGSPRSQNSKGHLLGHVRDLGLNTENQNVRVYQTSERQHFHTDSCDAVSLLCIREAKKGGISMLASTLTIYNEFQNHYPELLVYLFKEISRDRRGEVPEGEQPFYNLPVLNWYKGNLTGFYHRPYIDSAQFYHNSIKLTTEHKQALDKFDEIANDDNIHLKMKFLPGDIQFVYNHSILHDRTSYEDWNIEDKKRHLLRLWLSLPNDRPLPLNFAKRYGSITIGNRGGIITKNTNLHVPLSP